MTLAIVMINVETGSDYEVLKAINKIPNVKEAFLVYGVYDIIAKVEVESMTNLEEAVIREIRKINKVRSTLTMVVYG